jgi:hypothetical protein
MKLWNCKYRIRTKSFLDRILECSKYHFKIVFFPWPSSLLSKLSQLFQAIEWSIWCYVQKVPLFKTRWRCGISERQKMTRKWGNFAPIRKSKNFASSEAVFIVTNANCHWNIWERKQSEIPKQHKNSALNSI